MKKKYVLFDFDGVIADTEESNSHYLGLALKEFGVELTEKDKQRLIGTHDQELLIEFLSRAPRKVTVGSNGGFGYRSLKEGVEIALLDSVILAYWKCTETKERKKQIARY